MSRQLVLDSHARHMFLELFTPLAIHHNIPFLLFAMGVSVVWAVALYRFRHLRSFLSPVTFIHACFHYDAKITWYSFYYWLTSRPPLSPLVTFRSKSFLISTDVGVTSLSVFFIVSDASLQLVHRRPLPYIWIFF